VIPTVAAPKLAPQVLKAGALRAYRASGVTGSVGLSFTNCLGPCSEANVVFVYIHGRPFWFRRMNSLELFVDPADVRTRRAPRSRAAAIGRAREAVVLLGRWRLGTGASGRGEGVSALRRAVVLEGTLAYRHGVRLDFTGPGKPTDNPWFTEFATGIWY
jgi:(2Fe-2S) ferredoxin